MHDPPLVRGFQRLCDLPRDGESFVNQNRPSCNASIQALAVHEFEYKELLTVRFVQAVDRPDVWMVQRGEDLGFSTEAREAFGIVREALRKDLQGDIPPEFRVPGAVDFAHPAGADERDEVVGAEARPRGKNHRLLTRP
jgi:hypothetical protein